MNLPMNWEPVIPLWVCFCFVFVLFWWVVFALFVLLFEDDGLLDYVQVLHQFSFVALNSRRPRELI